MPTAASADIFALAEDLHAAGLDINNSVHQILTETAQQVQANAVSLAPHKTGALQQSIQIRWIDVNTVEIYPSMPYGVYQEFGTGTRGEFGGQMYTIKPKKPDGVLVFKKGGVTVYTREVHHPGIPAHPFMRPALIQALGPFADQLAKQGALQITQGKK